MAGRFMIRRDSPDGRSYMKLVHRRHLPLSMAGHKGPAWVAVLAPEDASRFYNLDTAESEALLLAAKNLDTHYSFQVVEWDGNLLKRP